MENRGRTTVRLAPLALALLGTAASPGVARAQRDAAFEAGVDGRLAAHPFFGSITLIKSTEEPPFLFYVQRPPKDDPDYLRKVVNSYLPFLNELLRVFDEEYAKPLALSRSTSAPAFAIVVLNSRGFYGNYAQKMRVGDAQHVRAHYDPRLQVAVTYVDAYAPDNTKPEERQAVLHEIVHALQHAYSATGNMPKPVWFNEGLAEFRSSCTHVKTSLRDPVLDQNHLATLVATLADPRLRPMFAPLPDLLASESYADVLERAQKRSGSTLAKSAFPLQVFYAQASAFVEFLHRADEGRYRAAFQEYAGEVERGASGPEAFEKALRGHGGGDLAALEGSFRTYVLAEAERRLLVRLGAATAKAAGADLAAAADADVAEAAPMPPPIAYDAAGLSWRDDELDQRIAAALALCASGDYEAAVDILPDPKGSSDRAARVRARAAEALRLRDELLRVALDDGKRLAPTVGDERIGGTVVSVERNHFVLRDKGDDQRLPLTALDPSNLANELRKHKLVRPSSWQRAWLDWLGGESSKRVAKRLEDTSPEAEALRRDLDADFDRGAAAAATALVALQRLEPGDDPAVAREQLAVLRNALARHRDSPLLQRRREALQQCGIALAQRAFSLDHPECLGIAGEAKESGEGRIAVTYAGSSPELASDFAPDQVLTELLTRGAPRIAASGSTLRPVGDHHELAGSGVFTWTLPLRGRHAIEVTLEMVANGAYGILDAVSREGGVIKVSPGGVATILDTATRLADAIGKPTKLYAQQVYAVRVENDGKSRVVVTVNGERTAEMTDLGHRVGGLVGLFVHASSPLLIHSISIEGEVDTSAALELRERYVERVRRELWP